MIPSLLLWLGLALGAEPTLPSVQSTVPVDWPQELVARGERVVVLLELAIDAEGRVVGQHSGPLDWSDEAVRAELAAHLEG